MIREPWFGKHRDMWNYGNTNLDNNLFGNRRVPTLTFRIMWDKTTTYKGSQIITLLFTALITQLQWLTLSDSAKGVPTMVSAVVMIQTAINQSVKELEFDTIVTRVAYLTYAVTGVYVFAVALMTYINIAREKGQSRWLVKHQSQILKGLRSFGLLL